jgi:2-keto-4-pentenoate hydratase/2-oxohepta-3-ene-1,7-dioic acid hydratase in catechol pathway
LDLRSLTYTTIREGGRDLLGIKVASGVIDLASANAALGMQAPETLDDLLSSHGDIAAIAAILEHAAHVPGDMVRNEQTLVYGPLVSRPQKIMCVGLNYRAHAAEAHQQLPAYPELFSKYASALNRHGGTVDVSHLDAEQFDYEAELVMIVGKRARNVGEADALDYVFGYATGNDMSARDLQFRGSQWMLGKISDGFAPLGPYLVGARAVGDPQALTIECRVNGELRQSASTADMVHGCAKILSYASQYLTLEPGDVIFTGTPSGVILGQPKERQVWLKPGDVITTTIEKLGTLEFSLV